MAYYWMYIFWMMRYRLKGDVLARLHNYVYDKFGFIAIFTAVDSQTASRFDGLLRTSDVSSA